MSSDRTRRHLDEALRELGLKAETVAPCPMPVALTIADELERIDAALGPAGNSLLFAMAQSVRAAVVELEAARRALEDAR